MGGLVMLMFVVMCGIGTLFSKAESDTVNIGAIMTVKTINGKVSTTAMKAAVDDVNADLNVLPGKRLSLSIHDANFSGFLSIVGALEYMEADIVAVIGPHSSVMAHVLSNLANELHVPFLSFTALDPSLSPLQYPYFIQTAPNDLYLMTAIAEMISYFGYHEVSAIYTDDDQFRNSIYTLGDELSQKQCKLSYKAPLPPDASLTPQDIHDALVNVRSMESRVVVLHTYSKTGLSVFETAKRLGMMKKGYIWIATTWLSTVLDSTGISSGNASVLQGVITLRPHIPDSDKKRDFERRWKILTNGSIGLNPYGLYAYDTVWMIAHALDKFFNEGGNISFSSDARLTGLKGTRGLNLGALSIFNGGKQLRANLLQTNMTGLTGPVGFNPDQSVIHPSFDIVNIVGNQGWALGYWSNYSGLSVEPPETFYSRPPNRSSSNQQLRNVVWAGNTTEKPRGWEFSNNGRKLRIGVPLRASFKEIVTQVNGSNEIHGFSIDVFLAALKLIPYPVPYEFVMFGDGHKNPSYTDFVNKVAYKVFDAAVGDIAIITNRTKAVDFTQPYIESGLVVVVPIKKLDSSAWAFLRPFTPLMWTVTAVFFIIVGVVVWILELGALRLPSLTSIFSVSSARSSLFPRRCNHLNLRKLTSAAAKSTTEVAEPNQKLPVQEQGITPRSQDFNAWYLDVISLAELADYGPVRGTMVIRPYGYAIWEAIQDYLNVKFKETGHSNMYFPQFIPYSFIEKEASHVEGFSPELALVTVGGGKELEEKLVVRPTSETIVNHMFTQWIQSYRDLPLMINQWANVTRWEMRTKPFIRTLEFLWQEGHTAHATPEEAEREAMQMIDVYTKFAYEQAAMPVIPGRKSRVETFAGADRTYTIEAMMGDRKALQAGTSHNLGQNFSRAFGTQFADENGQRQHVWQTSWAISTRFVGGIIMTHGDDAGLMLPPRLASVQVVIVPIWKKANEKNEVLDAALYVKDVLHGAGIKVKLDDSDQRTPGWKFNFWEMKGVPLRIEIGPRDVSSKSVVISRRDIPGKPGKVFGISMESSVLVPYIKEKLDEIQSSLLDKAIAFRDSNIVDVSSYDELKEAISQGKWARGPWIGSDEDELKVKEETGATIRCFPFDQPQGPKKCLMTGRPADEVAIFAKSY